MTQPYDDVVIEEHRWIVNSGVSDICTKPKSKIRWCNIREKIMFSYV